MNISRLPLRLACFISVIVPFAAFAAPAVGDIDLSGRVDAVDIQLVITEVLGIATGYECDIDLNGRVDAVDVQLVINTVLGIDVTTPSAKFEASPAVGEPPFLVTFTDNSTPGLFATISSWLWDFGDGAGLSTEQHPVHTYDLEGTYTVSLTVTTEQGSDTLTRTDYIVVSSFGDVGAQDMIQAPAGSFVMGARDDGDDGTFAEDDEYPRHNVYLDEYEIGLYEVTNSEYAGILNWALDHGYLDTISAGAATAHGQKLLDLGNVYCQISYMENRFAVVPPRDGSSMKDHPVVNVSWYGAVAYCNWLSEANGLELCYDTSTWTLDPSKNGYRLPTEAEWERAAAWDGSEHWTYGCTTHSIDCSNANHHNGSFNCNPLGMDSYPYTSPVGYYTNSVSPAGCHDMSGNVWEWCHDWYGSYSPEDQTNPTGPGSGSDRVFRGGSWGNLASYCRTARRLADYPEITDLTIGFRVARRP